jgi:hypothetical protein
MNRRQTGWLVATALLALVAAATAPAFPMVQGDTDPEPPPDQAPAAREPSRETVEQILEEQEQLLRGQRFTYDPGNRRDPFLSLYDKVREGESRPPGIEGMALEEIDLTGIVEDAGGNVAYFTGSDNKGYFLRVGQRIYKATMIAIDPKAGSVTFRQQVDDPRQIKPYRDVVRKLVPMGEESGR